jgi:hypothetical protein
LYFAIYQPTVLLLSFLFAFFVFNSFYISFSILLEIFRRME